MGQCGCGEIPVERAYALKPGCILGVQVYHGCAYCGNGPGVAALIFNSRRSEYLEGLTIRDDVKPDAYGGGEGCGVSVGLFDPEDLIAATREMERLEGSVTLTEDGYESVADWMQDFGLRLIQDAMRRFQARTETPGGAQ